MKIYKVQVHKFGAALNRSTDVQWCKTKNEVRTLLKDLRHQWLLEDTYREEPFFDDVYDKTYLPPENFNDDITYHQSDEYGEELRKHFFDCGWAVSEVIVPTTKNDMVLFLKRISAGINYAYKDEWLEEKEEYYEKDGQYEYYEKDGQY